MIIYIVQAGYCPSAPRVFRSFDALDNAKAYQKELDDEDKYDWVEIIKHTLNTGFFNYARSLRTGPAGFKCPCVLCEGS